MPLSSESSRLDSKLEHARLHAEFSARVAALELRSAQLSALRLVAFLVAASCLSAAAAYGGMPTLWAGIAAALIFVVAVLAHVRVSNRQAAAAIRRDLHQRYLERATLDWLKHPAPATSVSATHPYAADIDLVGQGSLLQRIDTSQTAWGERTLVTWLSEPASSAVLAERQLAVAELADALHFRQELEASGAGARTAGKLSGERFIEFATQPAWMVGWRRVAAVVLPVVTLLSLLGLYLGVLRPPLAWLALAPQLALVTWTWRTPTRKFALLDARRPQLEALATMLAVLESATFEAALLRELRARLDVARRPPSAHVRAMARLAGWADLRFQYLVHPFLNLLLLWDWQVLWGLERWNARAGSRVQSWFETLAELEALASLSVLRALEDTTFPEIVPAQAGVHALELAHPLLAAEQRVANDVTVGGLGYVLIVTGSNMAGKSTLLRAVGLNIALALAGGPVCAKSMRVPLVRLRSCMRVDDSLQRGASYFHAELARLQIVVAQLTEQPPVFFLFDELLRGTNASARRTGAMAIVLHLVAHGALGLVATHDAALCDLVDLPSVRGDNVHLTDVIVDKEMVFDYRLRPGRATTSNALELLARAGIPLPGAIGG